MLNLIKKIYRSILPESLRYKILETRKARKVEALKNEILNYYKTLPENKLNNEVKDVLTYLEKNPLHVFPYEFQKKYRSENVIIESDKTGLKFVMHEGKKLYFKRSWPTARIQNSYSFLQCEQHPDSPHKYLTPEFKLQSNSVVIDAGAAEGIFPLALIENIKHLYLIETDAEWIEALQATYAPWKEKVTIINKFVSNKNDEQHVSLDSYFKNKAEIDFIKIDVDGAETDLLDGAKEILSTSTQLKLALCTYHRQQDEKQFGDLLKKYGFKVTTSKGYMLFFFEGIFEAPYLRRGLIRAEK